MEKGKRDSDLLTLMHTDVCGPLDTSSRGRFQNFITFNYDYIRYGYLYLMKHKSESLKKFKELRTEVQNQLSKNMKNLQIDQSVNIYC